MAPSLRKAAEGAVHARSVVGAAKGDAEKSGEVVREAVAAVSGIEQSSRQIGQIIGVIDEIVFQTNLLALNAGVEAARAGDAGRGPRRRRDGLRGDPQLDRPRRRSPETRLAAGKSAEGTCACRPCTAPAAS